MPARSCHSLGRLCGSASNCQQFGLWPNGACTASSLAIAIATKRLLALHLAYRLNRKGLSDEIFHRLVGDRRRVWLVKRHLIGRARLGGLDQGRSPKAQMLLGRALGVAGAVEGWHGHLELRRLEPFEAGASYCGGQLLRRWSQT